MHYISFFEGTWMCGTKYLSFSAPLDSLLFTSPIPSFESVERISLGDTESTILTHLALKIHENARLQRFDCASRRKTQKGWHAAYRVLSIPGIDGYQFKSAFQTDDPVTCGTHEDASLLKQRWLLGYASHVTVP